jgi:predicted permease
MALSLALLVGAVLFLRTFQNLLALDTGYERDHVVVARFDPRLAGLTTTQLPALYQRLVDQARLIPGIRTAAMALNGNVSGSARVSSIVIEGRKRAPGSEEDVHEDYVGPDYFATVGITLLRGRDFNLRDDERSPKVAVVNETMARRFFGDASPLAHRFGWDVPVDTEIVGVVRDARVDGLRRPTPMMVYYPLRQHSDEFARCLYVRISGSSVTAKAELARAVAAADHNLAIREVATLAELTERSVSVPKAVSELTGAFGLLAVALACLGLYGTVSYSVTRRTNELGVRLALGASPGRVRWLVLRETMGLVGLGAAVGLVVTLPALTYVASLLFGLSPRDPATLTLATVILLTVGVLAGAVPAWRASRVDPLTALRSE